MRSPLTHASKKASFEAQGISMADYFEDQEFDQVGWEKGLIDAGDYEGCVFSDIRFEDADLTGFRFVDCKFIRCQFGDIHQPETVWSDVLFEECKLTGTHFTNAGKAIFSVGFSKSKLDMSSFYKCNLRKTVFTDCSMREVDFTDTDLKDASFINCDLADAKFENTDLQQADLRSAFNYRIHPEQNRIRKARFSWPAASGLLAAYGVKIEE